MPDVILTNLEKRFPGSPDSAVAPTTLTLPDGEFICLLGPSGCGKTTTLRMIAGLETPSGGTIRYGDRVFSDARSNEFVPPEKRDLGLMFQSYALWPHMTVKANIEFGLKQKKTPRVERETRLNEMEALFQLDGLMDRYVSELSGGQQQRVALARMLAVDPTLLLLDEPLSNLDAALRLEMRTELKRLHQSLGCTIVFVTHDQFEAMSIATSIVVMNEGRVVQMGPPLEVYHHPINRFVAKFVGSPPMNIFLVAEFPEIASWATSLVPQIDGATSIGIRPEAISIHATNTEGSAPAVLDSVQPTGAECTSTIDISGGTLYALTQGVPDATVGDRVWLGLDPTGVHGFAEDGTTILV